MRKIASILIVLFSVLTMWGQNKFTYKSATEYKNYLDSCQNEVISQAESKGLISSDDNETRLLWGTTFKNLQGVLDEYNSTQDEELKLWATEIAYDFFDSFEKAIFDKKRTKIYIDSNNFVSVLEQSSKTFEEFNDSVKSLKANLNETNQSTYSVIDNASHYSKTDLFWFCFLFGLVVISLGLNIFLIFWVSRLDKRIDRRKQEIKDIGQSIKINDKEKGKAEKTSAYRGVPASSYVAPPILQPQLQPVNRNNHQSSTTTTSPKASTKTSPENKTPNGKDSSKLIHLYGVAKTNSSFPEFYKVSEDESVDKAFVLVMENKEDNTAEYSISPIMSADFKKSVIQDRETFLPLLFCEKTIESSTPTSIEVVSKGKAHKVDGKWQVRERMVIRLV